MTASTQLKNIDAFLESILDEKFPIHPFCDLSCTVDYKVLLEDYLAMSQAFPYLQAGSQKDLFWDIMENNNDVPEHMELTTVVGNFLCWDETGGLYPTMALKMKGLPRILETHRFHYNILRQDCEILFGRVIKPNYSKVTKNYLIALYDSLSSADPIQRVASMVSFESHANRMITALWDSIAEHFKIEKNKLAYFALHVGENPAEIYHVEMTRKLINKIVGDQDIDIFRDAFLKYYGLNSNWCSSIVEKSRVTASEMIS